MKYTHGVRDSANHLIGLFESELDAEGFIKRNDPNGLKGFRATPLTRIKHRRLI